MGCQSSKPAVVEKNEEEPPPLIEEPPLAQAEHLSTRQNLAWIREDVDVADVYDFFEIIGRGSMGEVRVVRKKRTKTATNSQQEQLQLETPTSITEGGRKYACKTINTVRFNDDEMKEYMNEINFLRELDHPNIIHLFQVFKKRRKLWIIMECCTGGDLTKRMDTVKETDVATVMEQIVRAIAYMHNHNVCHRDIKLENVLYADSSPDAPIKLIDFGLSNKFTKDEKMLQACGTVYTAAPEVLLGLGYSEQTDIWSIGCVAFILLSGDAPFLSQMSDLKDVIMMDRLKKARFTFGYAWNERQISSFGKEFVTRCLQADPIERWKAKEALEFANNVWLPNLESNTTSDLAVLDMIQEGATQEGMTIAIPPLHHSANARKRTRMDTGMVTGMKKFVEYGELKKTILLTMAHTMDKSSLCELRDVFTTLDSSGSGTVSLVDLKAALKQMHSDKHLSDDTIEKLFYGIDVDSSGEIHYNEFVAAALESQGLITMEYLADAFERLGDEKGYIAKDDLKKLLGTGYVEESVNQMIDEADYDKDGRIDYDEFLRLMFGDPASGLDVLGNNILATSASDPGIGIDANRAFA